MTKKHNNFTADRGFTPALSSTSLRLAAISGALALTMAAAPAIAQNSQPLMVQPIPGQARQGDPLSAAISEWRMLERSDTYSFSAYANFLTNHPGWPGEGVMRKNAEKMLRRDGETPSQVAAFFARFPALSATAQLRHAEALDALGKRDEAKIAARSAWLMGAMVPEDEARLLSRYSGAIQSGDHDTRMDKLLWARSTQTAIRQIGLVSAAKRDLFNARLGFLTKAIDTQLRADLVKADQRRDAGYIADRVYWLRSTGQAVVAQSVLAQPLSLAAPPANATTWLEMLEGAARTAASEGNSSAAYAIGKQLEVTYGPGVPVRDRPFAERDSYTDIAWIAGMAAFEKLNRPADAIRMFELYANAAKSPQTRAKGFYWAGRAAEQAGRKDLTILYYTSAAEYFDQFHGQLAHERLGRPVALPLISGKVEISSAERASFDRSEVVRATVLLGQQGMWQDQTRFVRTLAANAEGEANHVLAADLATRINRPDLGLLVGKSAREDGLPGYFRPSFPVMTVPGEQQSNWTMIHAITRQESQFDREALSRAGARGLMQLMPGTARETAPAAGVVYSLSGLTQSPQDNIRLGSTYFGGLMTRFNGSYVLSVAAYNAGPGNVNKWLRANGDPRVPGTDIVKWVEAIPISETRGYVQRVLENAVVYDLLNPNKGGRGGTRISSYLGGYPASSTPR
jgi:soluble lytic murein transglycosylase